MKKEVRWKITAFFCLIVFSIWSRTALKLNTLSIQCATSFANEEDDGPKTLPTGDTYDIPLQNIWTSDSIDADKQKADTPPAESQWLKSPIDKDASHWTHNSIPKRIHKVYLDRFGNFPVMEEKNEMTGLEEAHKSWISANPGYSVDAYNLAGCRKYLDKYFHPIFLRTFDCIGAFAGKADFFRMAVVYREGGWYSDWKQVCLQDGLLDSLGTNVSLFVVWDHGNHVSVQDQCIQNCFFGATPSHPAIANMLAMIMYNVHTEYYYKTALHSTGPCLFNRAYQRFVDQENPNKIGVREGKFKDSKIYSSDVSLSPLIQHKCTGCGGGQNWKRGNDYNHVWVNRNYFCPDAKSLFESSDLQSK